ncbi:PREDICTED: uncharacterized protein LOC109587996 [Amphimedon queenslandica]|uniref:Uncharacterized protein n=1 Tax=Amphimedon queenslandica TaxID=400682 RepID=A0AAN0JRX5_AMPQE|nr:PREDICTED: uncharacterized protein LOC109587996 [Amphimedon queenslandica]|eukprot:XP_019859758.1 PREDICTED: uncharacterized protein LOC109587996 [Amphimedon queenslandica]
MNWEKYGLRIGVQKESLLSSETVEAAVVALVGGQFQFPPNTVLVSAVYAVSLSKPLLKRLKLEIQHCVDLKGRPALSRHLKFAIAPVSTPSLPYLFSIVEGGEFSSNSGYGFIERKEFCLVCILGEEWTNGRSDDHDDDNIDSDDDDDTSSTGQPGASGACKESTKETNLPTNTVSVADPTTTPNTDHVNILQSTGVKEAMTYAGLIYYEEKGVEDLVTFAAVRDLNTLIEFIKSDSPRAERGQHVYFCFKDNDGCIELKFGTEQEKDITGWTIDPHMKPCRLHRHIVNKFGEANYPLPPSCLISVYGSPGAVPTLHYSIPLEGVADPILLPPPLM